MRKEVDVCIADNAYVIWCKYTANYWCPDGQGPDDHSRAAIKQRDIAIIGCLGDTQNLTVL